MSLAQVGIKRDDSCLSPFINFPTIYKSEDNSIMNPQMPFTASNNYKHFDSFVFSVLLDAYYSPSLFPLPEYLAPTDCVDS